MHKTKNIFGSVFKNGPLLAKISYPCFVFTNGQEGVPHRPGAGVRVYGLGIILGCKNQLLENIVAMVAATWSAPVE